MSKKKGFAPKQDEVFWFIRFNDETGDKLGLRLTVDNCLADEDFGDPELAIFKSRKQATYVRAQMWKTWKKCIKKIYG